MHGRRLDLHWGIAYLFRVDRLTLRFPCNAVFHGNSTLCGGSRGEEPLSGAGLKKSKRALAGETINVGSP